MRCVEITAALVAETLIELGVSIVTQPDEIHWPNGTVSKSPEPTKKRKGKKTEKNKHGIFGQLVSDLAPKLPKQKKNVNDQGSSEPAEGASVASVKKRKVTSKTKAKNTDKNRTDNETETDFNGQHEGLPVQGRTCKCMSISS